MTAAIGRRWRGTFGSLLWLLVGAVLVVAMIKAQPSYDEKNAPLLQHGALKQRAQARDFAVTVNGFRLAESYTVKGDTLFNGPPQRVLRSPGVWMSVVAQVETLGAPGYVSARLRTRDGDYYTASGDDRPRVPGVNLTSMQLSPGLPRTGAFFFELPPERVAGAHVQFYGGLLLPPEMDSLLDVDLGTGTWTASQVKARTASNVDLTR